MRRPKYTPLDRECDKVLSRRAAVVVGLMICAFSAISVKIFFLQLQPQEGLVQKISAKRNRTEILNAMRGAIFDHKGILLAADEAVQTVVFDNIYLNEKKSKGALDRMAQALAKSEQIHGGIIRRTWSEKDLTDRYLWWLASLISPTLGKTPEEIIGLIKSRTNSQGVAQPWDEGETVLSKEINAIQGGQLKKLSEEYSLGCLQVHSTFRRAYPNQRDLTAIVGFINANGAVNGVEYGRREQLKGTPGSRTFELDNSGNELTAFHGEQVDPRQGQSLRLSLDLNLQEIVENSLDEEGSEPGEIYIPDLKAKRVMVVLLDAKTMAIRAMACRSMDQDPNQKVLRNSILEDVYEPGSTMKIVTVASALDSGKVGPSDVISINGPKYDDPDIEPITDDEAFGSLSVTDVLVHSSNIGAYKLSRMVGLRRSQEYVRNFGFGSKPEMGCGRESPGIVHRDWNYNVLARTAFGYNIAVTPLHMCAALGVILNDGWYKQPYLVEAVLDERNRVLEEHQTEGVRRVISASAAKATREAMFYVVERGTGTKAQSQDFYIAGKTGTARKAGINGYTDGKYVVSFLGFAPVNNPKLVGVVVIDTPKASGSSLYGGKLAAPVFRRIMERALRYYEVPAELVRHNAKSRRS